jgi:hypothetical protein
MEHPSRVQPSEWDERAERTGIRARTKQLGLRNRKASQPATAITVLQRPPPGTSYVKSGSNQTKSGIYEGSTIASDAKSKQKWETSR